MDSNLPTHNLNSSPISFIFFGSSPISVSALEALKGAGSLPKLIITQPDKPQGRHLELVASPVKIWAEENNIKYLTPEKIRTEDFFNELKEVGAEVFVLVSYGKIIPKNILELPKFGILNLHPSLLPKLRGPAPIENTILNDMKDEVGVTIMLLDEKMDEGPILKQESVTIENWPPKKSELYKILSDSGSKLLVEVLPKWINGQIDPIPQDNLKATYCGIIKKQDGLLDLEDDGYKNFLKFCAYEGWPGTYFFYKLDDKEIRIKITDVDFIDNKFVIKKVIPEGKREMGHTDFLRGYGNLQN